MAQFEYIGRAGRYLGKSIPQICLKLKDLGIGRMFIRETYKRYPGNITKLNPCYIIHLNGIIY